jgi:hypothetical protein
VVNIAVVPDGVATVEPTGPSKSLRSVSYRCEFLQQRPGLFQIRRVEALCEPAVDGGEEAECLAVAALIAPQTREARGCSKLKRAGLLRARDFERALE